MTTRREMDEGFYSTHQISSEESREGDWLMAHIGVRVRWRPTGQECPFCHSKLLQPDPQPVGRVIKVTGPHVGDRTPVIGDRLPEDVIVLACRPCRLGFTTLKSPTCTEGGDRTR